MILERTRISASHSYTQLPPLVLSSCLLSLEVNFGSLGPALTVITPHRYLPNLKSRGQGEAGEIRVEARREGRKEGREEGDLPD